MTVNRLAAYGTLVPGRANAQELSLLKGTWSTGVIRGRLVESGWGAAMGYPGLIPDPNEDVIEVHLFESEQLSAHWTRLDAFEGPGYRRVVIDVETKDGSVPAYIYALADTTN